MDRDQIKKIVPTKNGDGYHSNWILVFMAFLIFQSEGYAQEDPGSFDVRSASVTLNTGVYYLDAWIEYRLPSAAREALDSGVPLIIGIDVQFINPRWYWADEEIGELRQSYQIQYHSVSERYIILNLNTEEQTTFSTLFSALNDLGRIMELPLIDAALLDSEQTYDVRIRALLSTEDFPGPLRFLAFWRPDWSISSDWYRWQLDD